MQHACFCFLLKQPKDTYNVGFFFIIHCNSLLAYIAVRDLQSSQHNTSVQSLLLAGNFFYNQQQPSAGEGEVENCREFLEKNTIFNEHPVECIISNILLSVERTFKMCSKKRTSTKSIDFPLLSVTHAEDCIFNNVLFPCNLFQMLSVVTGKPTQSLRVCRTSRLPLSSQPECFEVKVCIANLDCMNSFFSLSL